MAKKKQGEKRNVTFRRIRGRIVPIVVGGAVAADAARTKRVFVDKKRGITIDRKTRVRRSLQFKKFDATELIIRKNGRKAGFANFVPTGDKNSMFNFLRIKKKFRGQKLSKPLTEQSARELKKLGANRITNQVIHPGSISTNLGKRDKLIQEIDFGGEPIARKVSRKRAIEEIGFLKSSKKRKKGLRGLLSVFDRPAKDSDIFRQTSLKHVRKKGKFSVKPFRTRGNKLAIAGGLALAGAGAFGLFDKKKKRRK